MTTIKIPYGRTFLSADIEDANLNGVFCSKLPPCAPDEGAEVERALDAPSGGASLEALAAKAGKAVVIASDHTRPVPSRIIMPRILARLRRGNPAIDITILIATGFHRLTTRSELEAKFGPEIVAKEKIAVHDSGDEKQLVKIGILPSGGELIINKLAAETDLLVSEGFIEPHFFAGFSGGRKSVLPGIASRKTVLANHCAEFIMNPNARTGVLDGNPIHDDMVFAAKKAKLAFIVNVVINSEKHIIKAFAGDPFKAHAEGCAFLSKAAEIVAPKAEIAITSNGGYPLDQNVYQSVKGMTAAEAVCLDGGVIIIAASCSDGHGGQSFYEHLKASPPEAILAAAAKITRDRTEPDQWEYQILARILAKHAVIIVTRDCAHETLREMRLRPVSTLKEAIELARALKGRDARINVIPDGVSVIARNV